MVSVHEVGCASRVPTRPPPFSRCASALPEPRQVTGCDAAVGVWLWRLRRSAHGCGGHVL